MYTTLITVAQMQKLQAQGAPLVIFDCSFDLMQPTAGDASFEQVHIQNALRADLNRHLSVQDKSAGASGGRHPLPPRERFAQWLSQQGVNETSQVVVYDRNGAMFCGRLWWMLKWLGHDAVALLDGGLAAWQAANGATESGTCRQPTPATFRVKPSLVTLVDAKAVGERLGRPEQTLVDARAPARFKGETEPLDPIAGHIPGALNRVFSSNLDAQGFFKPAAQLRAEFESLLGQQSASSVVHHCGSGVSAIPNLLAMEIAGLGKTALYAGSWSDWCSDPKRPVAQG